MAIDWNILATVAAPLLTLCVGIAVNRIMERRPRLVSYIGYVAAHKIQQQGANPVSVFTHSVVVRNAGRRPANNVRITHFSLPNFDIFPDIPYRTENLPAGGADIVIPVLIPNQQVTVSYLYFPPTTWERVNGTIQSDEGFAKVVAVLPTVQYPTWANVIAASLMLFGLVAVVYVLAVLVVARL